MLVALVCALAAKLLLEFAELPARLLDGRVEGGCRQAESLMQTGAGAVLSDHYDMLCSRPGLLVDCIVSPAGNRLAVTGVGNCHMREARPYPFPVRSARFPSTIRIWPHASCLAAMRAGTRKACDHTGLQCHLPGYGVEIHS